MGKLLGQRIDKLIANRKLKAIPHEHHPDAHELDDWAIYGPKNSVIADLVWKLAYDHDLRVAEIEELIETGLREKLSSLDSDHKPQK